MDRVYQSLGFEDEFDFVYFRDFPKEKKKEISKNEFRAVARRVISAGLPRKNFLEIMARTNFDLRAVEIVQTACNDSESKIGFESVDPALFSVMEPTLISALVRYISRNYSRPFVTGALKREDVLHGDGKNQLENVNAWIAKEENYYDGVEKVWQAYFRAEKRDGSQTPKVVVRDRSAYESEEAYLADVIACIRGIELMEKFRGEEIYAKAKALRLGGYPRLERYLFHKTRACISSSSVGEGPVAEFLNGD